MPAPVHVWRSGDNLQELDLFFYHVGSMDQTQITTHLVAECLYLLRYLPVLSSKK